MFATLNVSFPNSSVIPPLYGTDNVSMVLNTEFYGHNAFKTGLAQASGKLYESNGTLLKTIKEGGTLDSNIKSLSSDNGLKLKPYGESKIICLAIGNTVETFCGYKARTSQIKLITDWMKMQTNCEEIRFIIYVTDIQNFHEHLITYVFENSDITDLILLDPLKLALEPKSSFNALVEMVFGTTIISSSANFSFPFEINKGITYNEQHNEINIKNSGGTSILTFTKSTQRALIFSKKNIEEALITTTDYTITKINNPLYDEFISLYLLLLDITERDYTMQEFITLYSNINKFYESIPKDEILLSFWSEINDLILKIKETINNCITNRIRKLFNYTVYEKESEEGLNILLISYQ